MPQHSDFYLFVRDFFWMVFPIGAGIIAMFAAWLHHRRAQQALEVVQSFATQGKEVPPELLALIHPRRRARAPGEQARNMLLVGFILLAMAASFTVLISALGGDMRTLAGLYFVAAMFVGVAVAFFITAGIARRDASRADHT